MTSKPVEALLKEKKIYEIVNPRLVQASPALSITDAVRLMQEKKSGYIVVAQNRKVLGLFTEANVVQNVLGKMVDWMKPVGEVMLKDVPVLSLNDDVGTAIAIMGTQKLYHIPLVDENGDLANVISVRTLIRFLAGFYPTEIYNLPPKPDQMMLTPEGG